MIKRRRFLSIVAALPGLGLAGSVPGRRPVRWQGSAMGAEASLTLYHDDPAAARALIAACTAEIVAMEGLFSLFRRDSWLVRLNRDGQLERAPVEFVGLASLARRFSAASGGAFDVTVQPLWALHAGHFAQAEPDPDGPPAAAVDQARRLVDWRDLRVEGDTVWLARPGMAATFNGIAQGFVTDRVAALLRRHGVTDVLLDLGEFRGLGGHPDGRPWRVAVADPHRLGGVLATLPLRDQAVASSGGYGTVFDAAGRFHHLFDPARGVPSQAWAGVTVIAADATTADALSTALAVAPPDRAAAILAAGGGAAALLTDADGRTVRFEA